MKNYKSTESLCFSFLFTQMIGLLFDMLLSFLLLFLFLLFYFFAGFVNMCKPRTVFYLLSRAGPPGLAYYGSGLVCFRAGWGCWMHDGSVLCDLVKVHWKWNLLFFKVVPPNRLPLCLRNPPRIMSSLFSLFCLLQNAILHKMLKVEFWNFKPLFLRMQFSLFATFLF